MSDPRPISPRLRLEPSRSQRTRLDGAWWPRSTDVFAELPGLILAIDGRNGLITHVLLSATGWNGRARRLEVAGRSVRLGWYTTQPQALFTGICADGQRVDLLVIPPDLAAPAARAAMKLAANRSNTQSATAILASVSGDEVLSADTTEADWESEGGHL